MFFTFKDRANSILIWSVFLALYWVVFLWGFWEKGVFAFGFNATFFLALFLIFLGKIFPNQNKFWSRKHVAWLVPFVLLVISYSLYNTPFIRMTNVLVLPVLGVIFITYALLENRGIVWGLEFFKTVFARSFSWIGSLGKSLRGYTFLLGRNSSSITRRVFFGVVFLVIIVATLIVPLLSKVDPEFAYLIDPLFDFVRNIIETETAVRVLVGAIIAVLSASVALSWLERPVVSEEKKDTNVDSIIAGIVIAGIFFVYVLFLAVQIKRLWVSELPIDFSETEILVKSGFWQLFILSVVNALIFFATYLKTNNLVHRLLGAFTVASLFLVMSAAWRMFLYVVFYGFSYEKFFASYTVLFSIILFVWLLVLFFQSKKRDIIKFIVFLFLWMYSIVAIFPVEQFIMRANVALSYQKDSRIELYELTMLSSDVLGYVEKRQNEYIFSDWDKWIKEKKEQVAKKAWYESTIIDVFYKIKK